MFDLLEHIGDLDALTNPRALDLYETESTDDNGNPISRKETRHLMKQDIIATGPVREHIDGLRQYVEEVKAMAEEKVSTISVNGGTRQTPNAAHNVDLTLSGQNLPFLTGGTDSVRVVVEEVSAHVDAVELTANGAVQKSAILVETGGGSTHGRRTVMQKVAMTERTEDKITLSSYSADVEDPEGITAIETHIPMPAVTNDLAGIMPAADHLQITANAADIAALKGANKRFPVNEELPDTLTQEEVQEIWQEATQHLKPIAEGDTLISFAENTLNFTWTYFASDEQWHFRGVDTIGVASETNLGAVKSSSEDGKVSVGSGGAMSVNGFSGLEDGKADKVSGAVAGNLAVLDANGNIQDSGKNAGEVGKVETVDGVEAGTGKNVALHRAVTLGELQNLYEHPEQAEPGAIYTIPDSQVTTDLLQAAKNYVDETLALGDRDHYDPDMGIYWPNWDPEKTYQTGEGVNLHYRGFTAKAENANSAPCAGSPDWDFEPEDYVIGGHYEAYGAGGGASGGRGIFVTQGYGFYCTEDTALTQEKYDAVLAFINALPWPVPSWPVTGEGIPGAEEWRVLYGWPTNGRFQLSFYPGGVLRWVDPRAQLGLKETLDPAGSDPVMAKGIAAWVRDFVYPVGIIAAFANQTNPNVNFAPQAWEKLPDQTFLRNVTGTPGGTGGNNTVDQVLSHTHTLGAITVPSAGAHTHVVQTRGWADGTGGICRSSGGTSGSGVSDSAGAHTHTIPAGTVAPAPAGAAASVDNQPAYIDAAFWKRTA